MMRKAINFDMVLVLDGENVRAVGSVAPYYPATGPTYDCGGQPAEGGELEDVRFYAADGTEIEDPDGKILDSVESDIYERLDAADDGPDPDAAYDAMRNGD